MKNKDLKEMKDLIGNDIKLACEKVEQLEEAIQFLQTDLNECNNFLVYYKMIFDLLKTQKKEKEECSIPVKPVKKKSKLSTK